MKFSGNGSFELWDLLLALFLQGRLRGQSILADGSHSSVHTWEDDASTAYTWAVPHSKLFKRFLSKRK